MGLNKQILFAEWLAENHYYLYNVSNSVYYWKNEHEMKTTKELFDIFNGIK